MNITNQIPELMTEKKLRRALLEAVAQREALAAALRQVANVIESDTNGEIVYYVDMLKVARAALAKVQS